jgi:hypothetical protein
VSQISNTSDHHIKPAIFFKGSGTQRVTQNCRREVMLVMPMPGENDCWTPFQLASLTCINVHTYRYTYTHTHTHTHTPHTRTRARERARTHTHTHTHTRTHSRTRARTHTHTHTHTYIHTYKRTYVRTISDLFTRWWSTAYSSAMQLRGSWFFPRSHRAG